MAIAHPPDSWDVLAEPDPRSSIHRLAQHHIDDEVIAAGLFMPNAAGRGELSTVSGLAQRQLLKGRRAYIGERIILAATALHLYAVPRTVALPVVGPRFRESILSWERSALVAREVAVAPHAVGPAFDLVDTISGCEIAELRIGLVDDGALTIVRLLLDAAA